MTAIEVDGSLHFRFSKDWSALHWESADERLARQGKARKTVDIAAAGPWALLVEVKDDRVKDSTSQVNRAKTVKTGVFAADLAGKFRHSIEDILDVAMAPHSPTFYAKFVKKWAEERRLLLFWWELPPEPPSGSGTEIERWKAHLSALQNTLKQQLRDLTPRVCIANHRFGPDLVPGMDVEDVATGIGRRRKSIRSPVAKRRKAPNPPVRRKI